MKLLAISDVHGEEAALAKILHRAATPDVILLGGDLTEFGTGDDAERIVDVCREICPHVLAVAGNCDSPEIDRRLSQLGVSLFRRGVAIGGVGFYGLSAMPLWHGTMYEFSERRIAELLDEGRGELPRVEQVVIVSHPPPRGCVDRTRRGQHVGSIALREHIQRHAPQLVVCGHIHEARGVGHIGATTVVNCGPGFAGSYAEVEVGETVDVVLRHLS